MYYFGKFRYWCQKVLPLVYDDSLSYYEVLCKLIKYIEQMLGDLVNLGQDVTNLQALYVELKKTVDDYLSDDKIEEAIDAKLDQMVADGVFDELVGEEVLDFLQNKVDEYMAEAGKVPDGFVARRVFRQRMSLYNTALQSCAYDGYYYFFGGNDLATATEQDRNVKGRIIKVNPLTGNIEGTLETTNPNTLGHVSGMCFDNGYLYCCGTTVTADIVVVDATSLTIDRVITQNLLYNIVGISMGGSENNTIYVLGYKQGNNSRMYIATLDLTDDSLTEVSHFDIITGGNRTMVRQSFIANDGLGYFITNEGNNIYVTDLEDGGIVNVIDIGQGAGDYPFGEPESGYTYNGVVYLYTSMKMGGSSNKYWFGEIFQTNLGKKIGGSYATNNAIGTNRTLYVNPEATGVNPNGTEENPFGDIEECACVASWLATKEPRKLWRISVSNGADYSGDALFLGSATNVVVEGDGCDLSAVTLYDGKYALYNLTVNGTLYASNCDVTLDTVGVNLLHGAYSNFYCSGCTISGYRGYASKFELYNTPGTDWYGATANLNNSKIVGIPPINRVVDSHSISSGRVKFNIAGLIGDILTGMSSRDDLAFSFVHNDYVSGAETTVFGRLITADLTTIAGGETATVTAFAVLSTGDETDPVSVWFDIKVDDSEFDIGVSRILWVGDDTVEPHITGSLYDLRFYF